MTGNQARIAAPVLSRVLAIVGTQTDEVTVSPDGEDGWKLVARSADMVAMVSVRIGTPALETTIDEPFAIGVPKWIQALRGDGRAEIAVTGGVAEVEVDGMTTRLPLYPATDAPREPKLTLTARACVPVSAIRRLVDVTDIRGPVGYSFTIDDGGLTVGSHDENGMGTGVHVPVDVCIPEGSAVSKYPWKHWAALVKALPRDAVLTLSMESDYPMRVAFDLEEGVSGWWMVAPMIESE